MWTPRQYLHHTLARGLLAGLGLLFWLPTAHAYNLVIQPVLPPQVIEEAYTPLARYLSTQTGEQISLITAQTFFTYWQTMKKSGSYDLVLDAPHFTAYRIKNMDYQPLVKVPGVVSFSLVTLGDTLILGTDELVGKRIATLGSPSLGALRLQALYTNPIRQPLIKEVDNSDVALAKLESGEVVAAMIPTPLAAQHGNLNTIMTTEQVPHMTLSASPQVPASVQKKIQSALLGAANTPEGAAMLMAVGLPGFAATDKALYTGYESLLEGVWGY